MLALEPTYGRLEAGVRSTAVNHSSAEATDTAALSATVAVRRFHASGAAAARAINTAGNTGAAANIFVVNEAPNRSPAATVQRQLPVVAARTPAHAVAVIASVRIASVLFEWFTSTEIGVTANAVAPTVAPTRPQRLTTVAYTSATASTPAITCGTSNAIDE